MSGKDTCKTLKEIRKTIAEKNGIPLEVEECTYEGDCSGTCPKCEAELRELERALDEKEARGEKVDRTADIEPPEKKAVREFGFGDKPPFPEPLCGHIMPPPEEPRGERIKKQDASGIPEPLAGEPAVDYPKDGEEWTPQYGGEGLMGDVEAPEAKTEDDFKHLHDLAGCIPAPKKRSLLEKLRSLFRKK